MGFPVREVFPDTARQVVGRVLRELLREALRQLFMLLTEAIQ